MKSGHILAGIILIFFLVGSIPVLGADSSADKSLIQVAGSGTVKAAPDRADISFAVVTKNPDVRAAQKENARKMDIIISVLKDPTKGNINPIDIQTTSYSISEVYSPDDALKAKYGETTTIYEVSNSIQVETSEIDRVGDIIDAAVTNGANEVSSLDFTLSREKNQEVRKEALDIAVAKARSDAEVVSGSMDIGLGPVYEVVVDEGYQPPIYYNKDLRSLSYASGAASTPIEAGSVEVTAGVSVSYEIV